MATVTREQLIRYVKGLELKLKQYKSELQKRDEELDVLRKQVSFLQTVNPAKQPAAAPQTQPEKTPTATAVIEPPKIDDQQLKEQPKFNIPKKIKPLDTEDKQETFIKKADPGANERVRQAEEAKYQHPDEKVAVETSGDMPDEAIDGMAEDEEEAAPVEVRPPFVPTIHFESGAFLEAVLDGEEDADEMKSRLAQLLNAEKDERRNVLTRITALHWQMINKMGKRILDGLSWEKRLFMRYGMLDERLMAERMDIWEQLFLDKSKPDETGIYFVDEWLEEIARGNLKFSTIDEMALGGRKPDHNASGAVALNYELMNIENMQRMAVGARANLVSLCVQEYCQPTRDNPVLNRAWMRENLPAIKHCDTKMFWRKRQSEEYEVDPLFIVSPGYGQNAGCWEPWSPGKKKDSGPRICLCVFPARNTRKAVLTGLAEYRWVYAKEDAMHYWLTEGLTGNWIQLFNKKEQRKDLKEIFVENYHLWVLYESRRIPKMEKRFREFFWFNVPFSDETKQGLKGGGLFMKFLDNEEKKKQREKEEQEEIERIKAEREKRKAARQSGAG